MAADNFEVGDRVGIKESPGFPHWSAEGELTGIPPGATGPMDQVNVRLDNTAEPVPVLRELLVRIAGPGNPGAESGWSAQAWPANGDRPGPLMYFPSFADLLSFVTEFRAERFDETIKVRVPPTESARLQLLKDAGAGEL